METNTNEKVTCMANFAYDAMEPDELTIRPGDVLRDVERLPGGWWRGELRGQRGMFPDNFVSVVNEQAAASRPAGVQGRCRAVFSYQPANPDELPLCVGDVLEVLAEVEEGWWQGRRQNRVGVFPSNFVVMLDPPQPAPPAEPAPALPPKPVKEQCRVLFPYTAVNEDELTLAEGDIVSVVSRDAPDRGWWRGELRGRVGLFPDNFVQLITTTGNTVAPDVDEKKPDRPPSKTGNNIYPILNKYSEKTASIKELTTARVSLHKENSTQSTITHTNKSESEKLIHTETVSDGVDGQGKKPPVPLKKSPTPASAVGGLFSGLKSKMMHTDKDKDKDKDKEKESSKEKEPAKEKSSSITLSSGSSSGGEWDRLDGAAASRANNNMAANAAHNANTFDHVERNSILNDPRAGRVKAPRRRPPSQVLRDDTPQQLGLSNGHDAADVDKPAVEKPEEIKPRAREWEKHRAPWMAELKLNQAKKTSFGADGKAKSVSDGVKRGSTDRILDVGLEEKRSSHSMEMSKSTSSISSRMSVMESFDETTKTRHSLDSKKESTPPLPTSEPPASKPTVQSPTAAGRTFTTMLEEIKKPSPAPPAASIRTLNEVIDKSPKVEKTVISQHSEVTKLSQHSEVTKLSGVLDRANTVERMETSEERSERTERPPSSLNERTDSLERRRPPGRTDDNTDALIAQLNSRITNLEKLVEVQHAKLTAGLAEARSALAAEADKRKALQLRLDALTNPTTNPATNPARL